MDHDSDALWPAPDLRERWGALMTLLAPAPGERVLDIGAGRGEALRYVARRVGPSGLAVGTELGAGGLTRIAEGLTGGWGRVVASAADAQSLPFADASFDAVLSVNVLEAVPDRARALAEMRRVLRPSGRAVVAHDDWESMTYAADDRELCRRAVHAYAASTFASYAASDGQMGRRLWGLFHAAGFRDPTLRVLPLVNTAYREPLFGWRHAQFGADLVAGVSNLTADDLERWRADLAARDAEGRYVFAANLYVCIGHA